MYIWTVYGDGLAYVCCRPTSSVSKDDDDDDDTGPGQPVSYAIGNRDKPTRRVLAWLAATISISFPTSRRWRESVSVCVCVRVCKKMCPHGRAVRPFVPVGSRLLI